VYSEVADVSDWQAMQALAERVHKQYGVLDILVNNAGVATAGDFLSTPIEDWNWVFSINVMGVVHGCKAFGAAPWPNVVVVILLTSLRQRAIMPRPICRLIRPVNMPLWA
jgi:NAD(P)-dependent dehydrogenase (short-subunit alcohol dehydrogenase family)